MATSLAPGLSLDESRIPKRTLWFFRHKLRRAFHRLIRTEFERLEDEGRLNRKQLAERLGKKNASVISRWLNTAGNLELDTISDLLVGMAIDPTSGLVEIASHEDAVTAQEEAAAATKAGTPPERRTVITSLNPSLASVNVPMFTPMFTQDISSAFLSLPSREARLPQGMLFSGEIAGVMTLSTFGGKAAITIPNSNAPIRVIPATAVRGDQVRRDPLMGPVAPAADAA